MADIRMDKDTLIERLEKYVMAQTIVCGEHGNVIAFCIASVDDLQEAARRLRLAEVPRG